MVHLKAAASVFIAVAAMAPVIAAIPVARVDPSAIQNHDVSEGKNSDVKEETHHDKHNHRAPQSSGTGEQEEVTIVVHNRLEDEVNGDGTQTHKKYHQNGHRKGQNHRQSGAHKHSGEEEILEEDIAVVIRPEEANGGHQTHRRDASHRKSYTSGSRYGGYRKSVDSYDGYERSPQGSHRHSSHRQEDEGSDDYRPRRYRHSSARGDGYRGSGGHHSSTGIVLVAEDKKNHWYNLRSAAHRHSDDSYVADDKVGHQGEHGSAHRHGYRSAGYRHSDDSYVGDSQVDDEGENVPHNHQHGHRHSSHRNGKDDLRASERTDNIEGYHSSWYRKQQNHRKSDTYGLRSESPEHTRQHGGYRTEKNRHGDSDFNGETQESFRYNDLD